MPQPPSLLDNTQLDMASFPYFCTVSSVFPYCVLCCSTRAFFFAKQPKMTPAEALAILAKLEGAAKSEVPEDSYV